PGSRTGLEPRCRRPRRVEGTLAGSPRSPAHALSGVSRSLLAHSPGNAPSYTYGAAGSSQRTVCRSVGRSWALLPPGLQRGIVVVGHPLTRRAVPGPEKLRANGREVFPHLAWDGHVVPWTNPPERVSVEKRLSRDLRSVVAPHVPQSPVEPHVGPGGHQDA